MPNYSHGTKLTLAAADEPPYLTVGTDVSAKYKGAFCEAKIIDVSKHVKVRVLFDGGSGNHLIDDTELKAGSTLEVGAKVEAKHPEKKQQTYCAATITKILDHSRYTVVFDDGDQCILRRSSICLKSGKHFAESETLDQLPLTNPEHFGNPVKVGQATEQASNHNNNIQGNQQACSNNQSSSNNKSEINKIAGNNNNNNNGKSVNSDTNTINTTTTNGRAAAQINIKQETNDKPNKTKTTTSSSTSAVTPGTPGRRGGKGRKVRDPTANSKHTTDMPDDPGDSSQDSGDADCEDSSVSTLVEVGTKLMVQYGKGKIQNVYEAKVNKIETNSAGKTRYFVHYTGWNNRYDEWVPKNRILSIVTDKENGARDGRSRHSEGNATNLNTSSNTASSNPTAKESNSVKDKDKDVVTPAKGPRRSRLTDTAPTTSSSATVPATAAVPSPAVATPARERDKTKEKEKDKDKEVPTKTRRSRNNVDSSANSITASSSASSTGSVTSAAAVVVKDEQKEKEKEREKEKEAATATAPTPAPKIGRPRQSETRENVTNVTGSLNSAKDKDKEPPTKTRRSKQVEASSTNPVSNASNETAALSSPSRLANNQIERDKTKETEKSTHQATSKEDLTRQHPSETNATESKTSTSTKRSTSPVVKGKDAESISVQPTKSRGSRQSESSLANSTVNSTLSTASISSSASSTTSSTITTTAATISTATSVATTNSSATTTSSSTTLASSAATVASATSVPNRDRDRDRDRDKEPPTKIRRSRLTISESSGNQTTSSAVVGATISTTTTTSSTGNGSAQVANPSTASSTSSSSSSSSSITFSSSVMSAYNLIDREKFNDLPIIDEPDCDKRISILQDKIMAIKQTYMSLRSELADLDRRKKRPRLERSNSDHINFSGVTCRN